MPSGENAVLFLSENVAAMVGAILLLTVALQLVTAADEITKERRAQVDARRIAQMLEIVDHEPAMISNVTFTVTYDSIEFSGDELRVTRGDIIIAHPVNIHSPSSDTTVSDAGYICIGNDGSEVFLGQECGIEEVS